MNSSVLPGLRACNCAGTKTASRRSHRLLLGICVFEVHSLGRRLLVVATVEENPQPTLHSGFTRTDPHGSPLCTDSVPLRCGICSLVSYLSLCYRTLCVRAGLFSFVVRGLVLAPRRSSPIDWGPLGRSSLLSGDALQDDQGKCRSVHRVSGRAGVGVGFASGFSFVSRLTHHRVLHRAWCTCEHCPDGSLPLPGQSMADQESLDVHDAHPVLQLQPACRPRVCSFWRLETALPIRLFPWIVARVGIGRGQLQ